MGEAASIRAGQVVGLRSVALPPPLSIPLEALAIRSSLPFTGRAFIAPILPQLRVLAVIRTSTRVDVGLWLRRSRLWALLCSDGLLLFAWGTRTTAPRPWLRSISVSTVTSSTYNHITGELLLEADGQPVPPLGMAPCDGYQVMANLRKGTSSC